jgi:hypothetical protein
MNINKFTDTKCFMTSGLGADENLYSSSVMAGQNKLECLSFRNFLDQSNVVEQGQDTSY